MDRRITQTSFDVRASHEMIVLEIDPDPIVRPSVNVVMEQLNKANPFFGDLEPVTALQIDGGMEHLNGVGFEAVHLVVEVVHGAWAQIALNDLKVHTRNNRDHAAIRTIWGLGMDLGDFGGFECSHCENQNREKQLHHVGFKWETGQVKAFCFQEQSEPTDRLRSMNQS